MSNTIEAIAVSAVAVNAQIGLVRNNKARKRAGEAVVLSKNWKLAGLSRPVLRSILDGETVTREFKSGRIIAITLA
jgi:hypothetical protein